MNEIARRLTPQALSQPNLALLTGGKLPFLAWGFAWAESQERAWPSNAEVSQSALGLGVLVCQGRAAPALCQAAKVVGAAM